MFARQSPLNPPQVENPTQISLSKSSPISGTLASG